MFEGKIINSQPIKRSKAVSEPFFFVYGRDTHSDRTIWFYTAGAVETKRRFFVTVAVPRTWDGFYILVWLVYLTGLFSARQKLTTTSSTGSKQRWCRDRHAHNGILHDEGGLRVASVFDW